MRLKTFRAIRRTNASAAAQDGIDQDVCVRGWAIGAAGPRRGDEAPQNARDTNDLGELLACEARGKRGGDAGGGCSAASREGG